MTSIPTAPLIWADLDHSDSELPPQLGVDRGRRLPVSRPLLRCPRKRGMSHYRCPVKP